MVHLCTWSLVREIGDRTFQHHLICEHLHLNYIRLSLTVVLFSRKDNNSHDPSLLTRLLLSVFHWEAPCGRNYKLRLQMKKEHTEVDVSEEVAQPILIWASLKRKEKEKRTNQISVQITDHPLLSLLLICSSVTWTKTTAGWLDLCSGEKLREVTSAAPKVISVHQVSLFHTLC